MIVKRQVVRDRGTVVVVAPLRFTVVDAGDRRRIGGALKLTLPQGPLDRVAGESRGPDEQRKQAPTMASVLPRLFRHSFLKKEIIETPIN